MTPEEIARHVRNHNACQLGVGALLSVTALLLWPASFWVFRVLVAAPFVIAGYGQMWGISAYIASVWLVVLLIEGVRYGRDSLRDTAYAGSFHEEATEVVGSSPLMDYTYVFTASYLISQFLFCAPRATVHAVCAFRSRIEAPADVVQPAAAILGQLTRIGKWVPAARYSEAPQAVVLLRRLKLIWADVEDGELQIRIPPGTAPAGRPK